MELLLKFLKKIKIKISDISKIFVNSGPGKFTSLIISLSIAKALSLTNYINLIGFQFSDIINKDYKYLIKLDKQKLKNKGLIKPIYSS